MKSLALISVFFLAVLAKAEVSERNFQAKAGQLYYEDSLSYNMGSIDIDDGGIDPAAGIDFDDLRLKVYLEHGLSDRLSLYTGIGYGFGEFDISTALGPGENSKVRGFDPLNLGLKYQKFFDKNRFFSRVNLGYGFAESETDSDGDSNRTSQVFTLSFETGYEVYVNDNSLMGGSFSFTLIATDAKSESEPDQETGGNLEVSLYYEKHLDTGTVFGGHIGFEQSAGLLGDYAYYVEDQDFTVIEFGGYFRAPLSEKLFLLGGLDYGISVNEPTNFFDGLSNLSISLGSRHIF